MSLLALANQGSAVDACGNLDVKARPTGRSSPGGVLRPRHFSGCAASAQGEPNLRHEFTAPYQTRRLENAGRDALATLITHPNMDVRTAAAAFLLRYRTPEAKAILEEAAKGKGLVAFESSEALKRWEEGTWALDPE